MQEVIATFMREPLSHRQWNPSPEGRRAPHRRPTTCTTARWRPERLPLHFRGTSRMLDAVFTTIGSRNCWMTRASPPRRTARQRRRAYEEVKEWTLQHTKQEARTSRRERRAAAPSTTPKTSSTIARNQRNMVREIEHPAHGR